MQITEKSTKETVFENVHICKNMLSKARGLMFSKKKNLLFIFKKEQKISLHMLFVFFQIYAIYLDKDKKVIEIAKLNPFISVYMPKKKANYVIETPYRHKVKIGQRLIWK